MYPVLNNASTYTPTNRQRRNILALKVYAKKTFYVLNKVIKTKQIRLFYLLFVHSYGETIRF